MGAGAAKEVWGGVVPEKQEGKTLRLLTAFEMEAALQGEMLGLRLTDGRGGGCQVEGPMLGAKVVAVDGGHEADVTFAGDSWRVW